MCAGVYLYYVYILVHVRYLLLMMEHVFFTFSSYQFRETVPLNSGAGL
jgi:hypothetical protein